MSDLTDTKKKIGHAIKAGFSTLEVPGELSRKVSTQLRLEAKLKSGTDLVIACSEVKAGRPPGSFALYWLFSLSGGFIYNTMQACGLSAHPNIQTPLIFSCTSHNLTSSSHFEVSPTADFDAVAAAICQDIHVQALPIIEGFETAPERMLDYILKRGPGVVRNPFTQCAILMHMANRIDLLDEIIKVASTSQGFYDFKDPAEARAAIIEPIAKWFKSNT
jgi:hypothetical protein